MFGNKNKMMKFVWYSIIEPKFFAKYTWSGKSLNGRKKLAVRNYPKTLELLHRVVKGSDSQYDYHIFLEKFKKNVIKYAYE